MIVPTPCCLMARGRPALVRLRLRQMGKRRIGENRPGRGREAHRHHETPPSPEDVGQLLLQRCGKRSKWLTGNKSQDPVPSHETLRILASLHPQLARTPGQQPRHLLHDRSRLPDTGAFQRGKKTQCIQALQQAGFSDETIKSALSTLGVPPGGHHPPTRSSKNQA